jgi:hypothetical protein
MVAAALTGVARGSHGNLLGAHLTLNLAGGLGTAIIGSLHTFFPSLTQTQLRFPRLQRPTYVFWLLGVCELAVGAAFSGRAVLAVGWRRPRWACWCSWAGSASP